MKNDDAVNAAKGLEAKAVRLLREVPGLTVHAARGGPDRGRDAIIEFGGAEVAVAVEVKHRVNPATAWQLVRQAGSHPGLPLLVVADEMTATARDVLVRHGVGIVDSAGNAHIDLPGLLVHVEGKRARRPTATGSSVRLSGRAGVVAQAILLSPSRPWGVTDLASEAGVSAGLTHRVLARLEQERVLTSLEAGPRRVRLLTDATALLDLWVEENVDHPVRTTAYALAQTPRQLVTRLADNLNRVDLEYAVTGAAAGSILAPLVTAVPVVEVWASSALPTADLCRAAGADAVTTGHNLVFLQAKDDLPLRFREAVEGVRIANRFRVYADLRRDPRRGQEQAENLRQEVIGF